MTARRLTLTLPYVIMLSVSNIRKERAKHDKSMSQTTIKRIHLAYGIVLSLLVITLGILLIASCLDIYHSGPRPFSVESVSEHFAGIALPFYLCLIWALGGFVLALALPIEKSRLKATASPQDTLRRLSAKLDAAHQTESIRRERTLRLVLIGINAALYLIGATLSLIYLLNRANFPAQNANAEILNGALAVGINLALPFALSIALCFINKASVKREIMYVKQEMVKQSHEKIEKAIQDEVVEQGNISLASVTKEKSFFVKREKEILLVVRCAVLVIGLVFVIVGMVNGGMADVVQKAIKICTECIGLG